MSLLTEWSSKRDPNKVDLKWIRHIQISTAEPLYIRTDHIVKTTKAMLKADKKLGSQFKKMGGGSNAKGFHDQLLKANNPTVENESLLSDEMKDFDAYVKRYDIDTSFEVDDTKIEPLKSPYPEVEAWRIPMTDPSVSEDEQNEEITEAGDTYALQQLEQN